jgi:iron(III) transport system ATP-binding protein
VSTLTIAGVTKSYGPITALAGADLTVPAGSMTAVLGPSGCGKTTLLRCVAGFERPDQGRISLDGRLVAGPGTHVPPQRRRVAVVPQEGALFPHLSVAGNVSYGLGRGARRSERVDEVLALVGLAGYGPRMPHQLSGGQQQRVAVARALAPRPSLVLLDEPFSALDAGLRAEVRQDIRAALRADGATAVLVTHDQGEALSVADQVAVMRAGIIVQSGPPEAVYGAPVDPWVAAFVGEAVLLPAGADGAAVRTPLGRLPLAQPAPAGPAELTVLLRPEQIRLGVPADAGVPATVEGRDFHGHDARVTLRLADGTRVIARVLGAAESLTIGAATTLGVDGSARAYDAPDEAAAVRVAGDRPGEPDISSG